MIDPASSVPAAPTAGPPDTAVLIVGGGPVGLGTALELSLHHVDAAVLESRDAVSPLRPRAKTTSARSMELFRRWDLAQEIRSRAPLPQAWSDEAVFCTTLLGREVTRFSECFGLQLLHDDLVAEGGQQIPQPLVEQIMREKIASSKTVHLLTGATVQDLQQTEDLVRAGYIDAHGQQNSITASYAVGCDGARSIVRDTLGASFDGNADSRPNFNVVFRSAALAERVRHGPAVHYWVLNPQRPGVIGRLDLHDLWWCIAVGVAATDGYADPEAIVREMVGVDAGDIPIEIIATDPWRARMQISSSYGQGRVYLAGDAAHQNPPWGGHGFNTGIGDAANLGWKLAAVIQGWAPPSLLATYETERRPVAAETITIASANMAVLAAELGDPRLMASDQQFAAAWPVVADAVQRTKSSEFHSLDLVLGTSYSESPIVVPSTTGDVREDGNCGGAPSLQPGKRLPHAWLSKERSLYDLLGADYTLLGNPTSDLAHQFIHAAQELHIPLATVPAPFPPSVAESGGDVLVLVRPDQHVAWVGSQCAEPAGVLRRVIGADLPR